MLHVKFVVPRDVRGTLLDRGQTTDTCMDCANSRKILSAASGELSMLCFRFVAALLLAAAALAPATAYAQASGPSSALPNGGFSSDTNQGPGQLSTLGASSGHPQIQAIDPVYDFGRVYSGTMVKHTFTLKNAGTAPLTISAVRTSCGCTAARPTKSQILPGEESDIAVSFDTHTDHGPATRTITVITNDPTHQQLELTIRGDVKVQVAASPS